MKHYFKRICCMGRCAFFVLSLGCMIVVAPNARTEYIISNSKITSVNTGNSRGFGQRSSGESSFGNTDQYNRRKSEAREYNNEYESAMMQLQEQILQLSKIVEKNSNRIISLEKQNALLLQDNLKLQNKVESFAEKLNTKQSVTKSRKFEKKSEVTISQNKISNKNGKTATIQPKKLKPKERLLAAKKLILNKQYTVAINDITEFLDFNGNSTYAAEFYFWRGVAYFKKGKFSSSSEDFVDSYSKTPNKNIAKYVLYFLGKSLRRLGKTNDAQIIEGKISVDYPDFNFKKEHNIADIK